MAQGFNMSRDGKAAGGNFSGGTVGQRSRALQHTWFELTRTRVWHSLALVPTDDRTSTFDLALEMAQMASLDPRNRVLVVNASGTAGDSLGAPSVKLGAPPPAAAGGPGVGGTGGGVMAAAHGKYWVLDCAAQQMNEAQVGMVEIPKQADLMRAGTSPYTMMIVAASALLSRPPMVTTARSVDAVALCVSLGVSGFADARKTLDLIGADRVLGTVAIRQGRRR
jgi:hypothetical protein